MIYGPLGWLLSKQDRSKTNVRLPWVRFLQSTINHCFLSKAPPVSWAFTFSIAWINWKMFSIVALAGSQQSAELWLKLTVLKIQCCFWIHLNILNGINYDQMGSDQDHQPPNWMVSDFLDSNRGIVRTASRTETRNMNQDKQTCHL